MAILVAQITWDASADGWVVSGGAPCCTWNVTYGETAGGWRWYSVGSGLPVSCSTFISKTLSWEDLGVPAGSTVNKIVRLDSGTYTQLRAQRSTTRFTASMGQVERQTVVGFVVNTQVIPRRSVSGLSWQSAYMTGDQILGDASTVAYSWRVWGRTSVPAKTIGTIAMYQDSLQIVIDYTPPATSIQDPILASGVIPFPR